HIAAHLDAIANRILPALRAGRWVILDRFWWSTWVYGVGSGASKKTLEAMIEVERAAWEGVVPTVTFLIRRSAPLRGDEPITRWRELAAEYQDLAIAEQAHCPVQVVDNEGSVAQALTQIFHTLDRLRFRVGTLTPPAGRGTGRGARRRSRRARLERD